MHIHRQMYMPATIEAFELVEHCVVPSQRPVAGRRRPHTYDIDVRDFVGRVDNHVLQDALRNRLLPSLRRQKHGRMAAQYFFETAQARHDFRASAVAAFVSEAVKPLKNRQNDPWQFPAETLSLGSGDCEDSAILLVALLLNAGVPPSRLRVAVGSVCVTMPRRDEQWHQHAWALYRSDSGLWQPLEPLRRARAGAGRQPVVNPSIRVQYFPAFLFNNEHLWQAPAHQLPRGIRRKPLSQRWMEHDPGFSGDVHRSLLDRSLLLVPECPLWIVQAVQNQFLSVPFIDRKIDLPDFFVTHPYDPRDHFDNAYIDESWARVEAQFEKFAGDPINNIDALTYAMHGTADFYAHSSFMCFANVKAGQPPLYDRRRPMQNMTLPVYGAGSKLDFSSNAVTFDPRFTGGWPAAAELWKGKLVSGRYALPGASDKHSVFEKAVGIPSELVNAPDFTTRYGLPHHDQIAIDDAHRPENHLFGPTEYDRQFRLRTTAAALHIQKLFRAYWRGVPQG